MTKNQKIAYMAGFFDGEGCICLSRRNQANYDTRAVEVQICQVDKRPLEFFQKHYSGSLHLIKRSRKNPKWQDCYHWHIGDKAAERCLRDLLPFLVIKKAKAKLAIKYRQTGRLSNIGNPKRASKEVRERAKKRNNKITKERQEIYGKFKSLV